MKFTSPSTRMRVALGALTAVSALTLAACSSGGSEPAETSAAPEPSDTMTEDVMETVDITVGVIPILDVAPIYLGVDQGFFEEEGLNLTMELAQGGAAIVPGVVSGQFQFGFSNTTSLILAVSNDLGIEAVAPGTSTTGDLETDMGGVLTTADSGITGPADLEGKKVAVNTLNNVNTSTINKMVRDAGGDPSTITYVELAFPDIVPAVVSGDVDAGQVVEPFLTVGKGQDLVNVGSNYAAMSPTFMVAQYFTASQYAADNPDIVERFESAITKSFEYASDNPDAVRAILLTYTSMDEATTQAVTLPAWPTEIDTATVDLLAELAVTDGFLTEVPDLSVLK
ncbi:ABC transporter substrate-binding protein [Demequina lignilytica]|uniref:ABC transporter substrate-binding protein n=1 Tax=Demequina lignilytica TaxID=3051663 RepID=A0AAW7M3K8_9MICO|nr:MULTISPECIES: ABC transporter substrate-binding protein [unclassified Demequina]MDN4477537.1 ABC transporter substrate-binding protein [Demequina sp. SYSU T00039-1]MDN4483582.1 ABC transporter substrate-binding protein [Demequina sp. SYSU T0a273]MDN4488112.1 ABC transporter substrate-binding protein [Demequina sp. SYSU T00039]MDN4490553.1 ABC transporter substrate-binding protein [Demequina sp. SYSU T00068]